MFTPRPLPPEIEAAWRATERERARHQLMGNERGSVGKWARDWVKQNTRAALEGYVAQMRGAR